MPRRILIIVGHPDPEPTRLCRALAAGYAEGARSADGRIAGTYLHGLMTSDGYRAALLRRFGLTGGAVDYRRSVDDALDGLAEELEAVLDADWLNRLMAG